MSTEALSGFVVQDCPHAAEIAGMGTKIENLYGNGREGRVDRLEQAVIGIGREIEGAKGWLKGAIAIVVGANFVLGVVVALHLMGAIGGGH